MAQSEDWRLREWKLLDAERQRLRDENLDLRRRLKMAARALARIERRLTGLLKRFD